MSSKIKVDTIENVAGSGNVSLGSGHNLVVPGDLTVDTNTLFVDASADKVGINQTSPTYQLTVLGATQSTVEIESSSTTGESRLYMTDPDATGVGEIGYYHNGDTMRFSTGGAERMRLSSTGLHIGGTAAANAIGNYEEGTWTPAFSSQIGTISMNSVGGRYQRVGNFVTASFWLNWSSISGNGSYGVQLTGLPFTSVAQIVSERDVGIILGAGFEQVPIINNNFHLLGGYLNQNATTATFRMSGGGQSERSLDGSISKAGGYLYGMVRYKAV